MSGTHDLFAPSETPEVLRMPDADVRFVQGFYAPDLAASYQDVLLHEIAWRQDKITLWGKQHLQPRLSAWYGDPGTEYSYSGLSLSPHPWTATLQQIRRDIEAAVGVDFNSVLLNLYRNEGDSMGWHSDDEPELGKAPVIASLSLGETRIFKFRHKTRREQAIMSIALSNGSLLVMAGTTQKNWLHGIAKERTARGMRINLTFRKILGNNSLKVTRPQYTLPEGSR